MPLGDSGCGRARDPAAGFIAQGLDTLPVVRDAPGSLILRTGGGLPKRLIACQLDELGFVVTRILDDGDLRLTAAGRGAVGTL